MKAPISVESLVWKYHSLSQVDKEKFGSDGVVPADDLVNAFAIISQSLRLNVRQCNQNNLLIKFLRDNESLFQSQDFQKFLFDAREQSNLLLQEETVLESKFKKIME